MRFTVVDEKEFQKKCVRKKLYYVFKEFMSMNVKVAEVNFTEFDYSSLKSAYNNLHHAAKRHCVPVQVMRRKGHLYFVRTDI
jgi:hypothetical protein